MTYKTYRKAGQKNENEDKFMEFPLGAIVTIPNDSYLWKIVDKRWDGYYGSQFNEVYITISMGAIQREIGHRDPAASGVIQRYIHHELEL